MGRPAFDNLFAISQLFFPYNLHEIEELLTKPRIKEIINQDPEKFHFLISKPIKNLITILKMNFDKDKIVEQTKLLAAMNILDIQTTQDLYDLSSAVKREQTTVIYSVCEYKLHKLVKSKDDFLLLLEESSDEACIMLCHHFPHYLQSFEDFIAVFIRRQDEKSVNFYFTYKAQIIPLVQQNKTQVANLLPTFRSRITK